jgi:hypothetical protein
MASPSPPPYLSVNIDQAKKYFQWTRPLRVKDESQITGYRLARWGELEEEVEEVVEVEGQGGEKMATVQKIMRPLKKYHVWGTSYTALNEFGVGIGLYYRQLIVLSLLLIICAIVYIPTIRHNLDYNPPDTTPLLLGSVYGANRADLSKTYNGIPDIIVVCILLLFGFSAKYAEKKAVKAIDMSQQTPSDYTVCVQHPPEGLSSPDEYFYHFQKWGEIVFVTVALNNGELLSAIARKRSIEHMIKSSLGEAEVGIAELPWWKRALQPLGLFPTDLEAQLEEVKRQIQDLSKRSYTPKRVYVTFNSEKSLNECLEKCKLSYLDWWMPKMRGGHNEDSVIAGKLVWISKAQEPSSIIWENLHISLRQRTIRLMLSLAASAGVLAAAYYVIQDLSGSSSIAAAIFISCLNALLPIVMKFITLQFERHKSVTEKQASLMRKLVVARMINSAILLYASTSLPDTFQESELLQIFYILLADAFTTPVLRLCNLWDFALRRWVAPKKKTQQEMNAYFQGAYWNLAERYTDMIKTVFVGLFYSSLVPTGLVVTFVAMCVAYWVDKYSLLRQWRRAPNYGPSLAAQSRKYIVLCVFVHVVMTRIFFSRWPYQDLANPTYNAADISCGLFRCQIPDSVDITEDQDFLVKVYTLLGYAIFIGALAFLLVYYGGQSLFRTFWPRISSFKVWGGEPGAAPKTFREMHAMDCYVPNVRSPLLLDPLFGVDLSNYPNNAQKYLPLYLPGEYTVDDLNMCSKRDLPDLSDSDRARLFASIKYYAQEQEKVQQKETTTVIRFSQSDINGELLPWMTSNMVHAYALPEAGGRVTLEPLPPGWELRFTAQGREYYVWLLPFSFSLPLLSTDCNAHLSLLLSR